MHTAAQFHRLAGGCRGRRDEPRRPRQVREERSQLPVRPRAQRGAQALVQLVEVDPALGRGLPEPLGDRVPVGVGGALTVLVGEFLGEPAGTR
ncbi:hypothetical protein STTU_6148 [Streptomyces sp. Tu6071]|nr:hypothetical protein STTU_6148 [Streptomyces sp. Tu6071]